ncbi:hypothetical protein [Fluviicola sp.]|uniref:hypothetical protein n=1 Tax=Fluviicola sp. TaxID=1917219 RepID=UPI003D2E8402
MRFLLLAFGCILFGLPSHASKTAVKNPDYFIIDSWVSGFIAGLCKTKEKRWKAAWKRANQSAKNDARIWGGRLFRIRIPGLENALWKSGHGFFIKVRKQE